MPKKAKRKTVRGKAKRTTTRRKTTAKRSRKGAARGRQPIVRKSITRSNTPIKSAYSKSQLLGEIADQIGLKRTDIKEVFESLSNIIERHMSKGGVGEFNMPGLLKCRRIYKKATKARKGINPFTGQETTFKAKPARNVVKVRPLKGLKEMVV